MAGLYDACAGYYGATANGCVSPGVKIQICALGEQDKPLSMCSKNSPWRKVVKKSTVFAIENITQTFCGKVAFGEVVECILPPMGSLLSWMYAIYDLPAIKGVKAKSGGSDCGRICFPHPNPCNPCRDPKNKTVCDGCSCNGSNSSDSDSDDGSSASDWDCGPEGPYAYFVNEIGNVITEAAGFAVAGVTYSPLWGHFMHCWEELSGKPGKRLEEMVGKRHTIQQLIHDSKKARRLYVPLCFWFTERSWCAFPICAVKEPVKVWIKLAPLQRCIRTSGPNIIVKKCHDNQLLTECDLRAYLDTAYVFLDDEEHCQIPTNWNNPSTEIIVTVQRQCKALGNFTYDYSGAYNEDPCTRLIFKVDNLVRFDREATFCREVVPYQGHTNVPKGCNKFIYCIPFARDLENPMPDGTFDLSYVNSQELTVFLNPSICSTNMILYAFKRGFNMLRFRRDHRVCLLWPSS